MCNSLIKGQYQNETCFASSPLRWSRNRSYILLQIFTASCPFSSYEILWTSVSHWIWL